LRVAVSATGESLEATVDPRFGRCPYYIIVDTDTKEFEALPNTSMNAPSGAGIGAAQFVAVRGVETVLTGRVGPNAMNVLSQSGIKIVTGAQGSVRQVIEEFRSGRLNSETTAGYGQGGFYGGRGAGRGTGRGMGARMGRGMGRGMSVFPYQPQTPMQPTPTPMSKEQEIAALTLQIQKMEKQLTEVRKRLEELQR